MNFDEYKSIKAINFSTLKHMATSPMHYRHAVDVGIEDKRAWELGRVCHTAVLEPFSWMDRYIIQPETYTNKDGKVCDFRRDKRVPDWVELQGRALDEGREIITRKDHDIAVEVSRAVMLNPTAAELFRVRPRTEVPIVWEHMGLKLKSRLDIAAPGFCVADLKTTRDISIDRLNTEIIRRDYLSQFAFYVDAWHAETGEAVPFKAIFVEKSPPFDVVVMNFSEDDLEYGRKRYEGWLQTVADCVERNTWPGVAAGGEVDFVRPAWAVEEDDDNELVIGGVAVGI